MPARPINNMIWGANTTIKLIPGECCILTVRSIFPGDCKQHDMTISTQYDKYISEGIQ